MRCQYRSKCSQYTPETYVCDYAPDDYEYSCYKPKPGVKSATKIGTYAKALGLIALASWSAIFLAIFTRAYLYSGKMTLVMIDLYKEATLELAMWLILLPFAIYFFIWQTKQLRAEVSR